MKYVELVISVDPIFFGGASTENDVEAFAFNMNKNIEKIYNVKSDYSINLTGNSYQVVCSDRRLEPEIAEYVEKNWHRTKPTVSVI